MGSTHIASQAASFLQGFLITAVKLHLNTGLKFCSSVLVFDGTANFFFPDIESCPGGIFLPFSEKF